MNLLLHSIPVLYLLGIGFAMMAFMLPIALEDTKSNLINAAVQIQLHLYRDWSIIPGDLKYHSKKSINLYGLDLSNKDDTGRITTVKATSLGEMVVQEGQTFKDPQYDPQSATITYTIDKTATYLQEVKTAELSQFNLGGLSLWYQIANPLDFQLSFKMISLIHDQFKKIDFATRMNAANAYSYLFKDKKMTMKAVLGHMKEADAEKIYSDPVYGMDSPTKLYYWAAAV